MKHKELKKSVKQNLSELSQAVSFYYEKLIEEGFTSEEALELILNWQESTVLGSVMADQTKEQNGSQFEFTSNGPPGHLS